ncbi:MAG TPA: RNA polymerase sigma factor [Candidatus Sulfopaludibacter sp.]|nr:RNA polymerase sigma factor [Candidatus Sulfopaludibacter sp.]
MKEVDYEQAVNSFYEGLYRFAFSLCGNTDDACELTQETYARLLTKGGQLRDRSKMKAWLFTTLYRVYLGWKRRETRHPHLEINSVEDELPPVTPEIVDKLEAEAVSRSLLALEELYRVPLALHYFENHSYREISKLLDIPVGTIMSRLSRGKELMRKSLAAKSINAERKVISINPEMRRN